MGYRCRQRLPKQNASPQNKPIYAEIWDVDARKSDVRLTLVGRIQPSGKSGPIRVGLTRVAQEEEVGEVADLEGISGAGEPTVETDGVALVYFDSRNRITV